MERTPRHNLTQAKRRRGVRAWLVLALGLTVMAALAPRLDRTLAGAAGMRAAETGEGRPASRGGITGWC